MLILTRRVGEATLIGDDIKVTILGVNGRQIRLGFDAPKGVRILREELEGRPRKPAGLTENSIAQALDRAKGTT